jgi:hypothetical protein
MSNSRDGPLRTSSLKRKPKRYDHAPISADDEDDPTELDATRFKVPVHKPGSDEGDVTEFKRSLDAPLKTDMLYRRVVATAAQAYDFHQRYHRESPPDDTSVDVTYGKLRVVAHVRALKKMHAWATERSQHFTMEVQGRFLARRRPDHILVDDFLPLPSFCQSLAYETSGPDDRKKRFGQAKMRTIAPDDWKPHETRVYQELGVFSSQRAIVFDPLKVQIPFHSHYTRSVYQKGPSPGDYDHLHHLKWLYTPVTGLNILYSGVAPFQVELPHSFAGVAIDDAADPAHNPADCRVTLRRDGSALTLGIPLSTGLVIGRDPACDLPVPDESLSRRHARVFFSEDGLLMLEDLGSKNGTLLEGKKIDVPSIVRRPTRIVLGSCQIEIRF